jgi:hypothetical protein
MEESDAAAGPPKPVRKKSRFFKAVGRWTRYLYFLRFSILLWVFPLVLVWANAPNHARSLVSGVVTPATRVQYLCVAFFLFAGSFVALILARVVVINGIKRFRESPPPLLHCLLADEGARCEWIAPVASQLNNLVVFWYFLSNGHSEGVSRRDIAAGLAEGVILALLFWFAVSAIYYLTYRPALHPAAKRHFGKKAARTLLFPRGLMRLSAPGKPAGFGEVLEDADIPFPVNWIARLFPEVGYRWQPKGPLYEGHYFALISALGFYALYWTLWPLTAPVPVPGASKVALILYSLGGLAVFVLVLLAKVENDADKLKLWIWKAILAVPILGFAAVVPYIYYAGDAERFPILALVLILVISITWTLGAIAFFADRFRIPVLTTLILLIVIPSAFHAYGPEDEHYLSAALTATRPQPPTPGEIVDNRLAKDSNQTFIIVTSTGGGIHAAAWTAAILGHLEEEFAKNSLTSFHDHVLLLSTVSGGSAGLYTYLRELYDKTNGGKPVWDRMTDEAKCSSLEAVGWGLVYYDIPKATVPLLPYWWTPSTGLDDLKEDPLGKDRTWALRKAFSRNLNDAYCKPQAQPGKLIPLSQVVADEEENPDKDQALTLASLNAMLGNNPYPAFTMNTTTVEDGNRLLLANYRIPQIEVNPLVPRPAESFLDVYGGQHPGPQHPGTQGEQLFSDLPLATAAQLSATFPYVSSAATFPALNKEQTVHFVDGGYYDNDGTASAIEFLRFALDGSKLLSAGKAAAGGKGTGGMKPSAGGNTPASKPPLRVLLVEIRNSPDTATGPGPQALKPDPNGNCNAWGLSDQLMAPLKAFYGGGHDSVTGRNRNDLLLLERAYKDRLFLQHFIIVDNASEVDEVSCSPKNPDKDASKKAVTDPLNWSLTPKQQNEVVDSAKKYAGTYTQIRTCFASNVGCPKPDQEIQ